MSVTIKTNTMKYRDPEDGQYKGVDVIVDKATSERIADINAAGAAQVTAVNNASDAAQSILPTGTTLADLGHNSAAEYVAGNTYAVGDYAVHDYMMYKCNTAHSDASWTAAHWTRVNAGDEITSVNNNLSVLDTALNDATDVTLITGWSEPSRYYYNTMNSPAEIQQATLDSGTTDWQYIVIPCQEGDSFTVSGTGGHYPRAWAFCDETFNVLSREDSYTDVTLKQIIAPEGATKLILNRRYSLITGESFAGALLSDRVEDLLETIDSVNAAKLDLTAYTQNVSVIPDGTDYNDFRTAGTYKVLTMSAAQSMSNCPTTNPHKLIVCSTAETAKIIQIVIPTNGDNSYYIRNYNSDNWVEWNSFAYKEEIGTFLSTKYNMNTSKIPNNTDYNNLETGMYICTSAASAKTMTNCPVKVAHRLIVMENYSASTKTQILIQNRKIWFRYNDEDWWTYEVFKPDIPEYYEEHIVEKETRTRKIISDAGFYGDSFAIVTDTHWGKNAKNSPDLVHHVYLNTPINRLMLLGDYYITKPTEDGALLAMDEVIGQFRNTGMLVHQIPGNHDYNKGTQPSYPVLTESQVYGQLMTGQNDVVCSDNTCSFYFDNLQKKIRYFFTSCMYDSSINVDSYKWIFNQFQNIPDGYKIIVFTHSGLAGKYSWSHAYAQVMTEALKAIKDHTTYTYEDSTYDYSTVTAEPIAIIAGHQHEDNVFTYDGILCIEITTDAYQLDEIYSREPGTIYEQAVELTTVDLHNKIVYMTRIGVGCDRINHYDLTNVATTYTLTPDASMTGTITWVSSDDTKATVSNGVVTKVASGYCVITATNTVTEGEGAEATSRVVSEENWIIAT